MFKEAVELTRKRRKEIAEELDALKYRQERELQEKETELSNIDHAIEGLRKVQAEYDKGQGNLAVQKRICPFPDACSEREFCTKSSCNADTCSNGYAYRFS